MKIAAIERRLSSVFRGNQETAAIGSISLAAFPLQSQAGAFDVITGGRPDSSANDFWVTGEEWAGKMKDVQPESVKRIGWRGVMRNVINVSRRFDGGGIVFETEAPKVPR